MHFKLYLTLQTWWQNPVTSPPCRGYWSCAGGSNTSWSATCPTRWTSGKCRVYLIVLSLYFNISSSIRIAGGYRYQTFLQNTVTSPPHLRTRKQNQLPSLPPRASTRSVAAPVEKMETRNKSLNLFRSQVDGCTDQMEAEAVEEQGEAVTSLQERLAVRNHLLKRKLEMEDEMMHLQKRACVLQERKEVN